MNKIHICPKCGGQEFSTTAHVMQDWVVNQCGEFLRTLDDCLEVDVYPDNGNVWTCTKCGAEAVLVAEEEAKEILSKFHSEVKSADPEISAFEIVRQDRDEDGDRERSVSAVFFGSDREKVFKEAKNQFDAIIHGDPDFKRLLSLPDKRYKELYRMAKKQGFEGNYLVDDDAMVFTGQDNGEMYFSRLFIQEKPCKMI